MSLLFTQPIQELSFFVVIYIILHVQTIVGKEIDNFTSTRFIPYVKNHKNKKYYLP